MSVRILTGDVRDMLATLPAESVHCVVTSPPYWGLRDYGIEGQIGMEPTMGEHIETMVNVFREVRRVLRKDGTVWLNYGDCYDSGTRATRDPSRTSKRGYWENPAINQRVNAGLKPKDLCMIPNRLAIALQDDGWWVRKEIIWHKSNPMPESATDRPTSSHEKVWLLTRSGETVFWAHRDGAGTRSQPAPDYRWVHKQSGEERTDDPGDPDTWKRINLWRGRDYFYDAEAVKTPAVATTTKMPDGWDTGAGAHGSIHRNGCEKGKKAARGQPPRHSQYDTGHQTLDDTPRGNGANLRDVWTIATAPFRGAHYATFPPDLVVPCIKAGTSEKGCCAECGAPWVRGIDRFRILDGDRCDDLGAMRDSDKSAPSSAQGVGHWRTGSSSQTIGWSPSCACNAATVPCTVLDPFIGSGTTAMVADRLGRDCIGIDLNPANVDMSVGRVKDDAGLFAEVGTP